jgi:hypothetical protein
MSDRPSSRVLAAPGGASQICFGDAAEEPATKKVGALCRFSQGLLEQGRRSNALAEYCIAESNYATVPQKQLGSGSWCCVWRRAVTPGGPRRAVLPLMRVPEVGGSKSIGTLLTRKSGVGRADQGEDGHRGRDWDVAAHGREPRGPRRRQQLQPPRGPECAYCVG